MGEIEDEKGGGGKRKEGKGECSIGLKGGRAERRSRALQMTEMCWLAGQEDTKEN